MNAPARCDDVPGEHRLHAEAAADRLRIGVPILVAEHRAARHHPQPRNLRQVVDQGLGQTVAQVVELRIVAVIRERQDGEGLDDAARPRRRGGVAPPSGEAVAVSACARTLRPRRRR